MQQSQLACHERLRKCVNIYNILDEKFGGEPAYSAVNSQQQTFIRLMCP